MRGIVSGDGQQVIWGGGTSGRVISTASGRVLGSLLLPAGLRTSGFWVDEKQLRVGCVAAKADGGSCVLLFDFTSCRLLARLLLALPGAAPTLGSRLPRVARSPLQPSILYLVLNVKRAKGGESTHFYRCNAPVLAGDVVGDEDSSLTCTFLFKVKGDADFALHQNHYIAAIVQKKLHVYDLHKSKESKFVHARDLSVVTFHPTEACVVTGDERGEITFWYCLGDGVSEPPIKTSLHWHAHAVGAIAFTVDGGYMLSGGREGVLVKWQLGSGNKDFLPRLGAPISDISVASNGIHIVTSHSDNTAHVISLLDSTIKQTIRGLLRDPESGEKCIPPTGIVTHPRLRGQICFEAAAGTLQFYNVLSDRHVSLLQVVPGNRVSRKESNRPLVSTHVRKLAFGRNGAWLATVEHREADKDTGQRSRIRFWHENARTGSSYVANTCVEHYGAVSALRAHPLQDMVVTCGVDRKFKIFCSNIGETGTPSWHCRSVGFYRDYVTRDAAFSADGSVLAVTFGQTVTLWNPESNTLCAILSDALPQELLRRVVFVGSSFLMAWSDSVVYMWNLLTMSVWWTCKMEVTDAIPDNSTGLVLVVSNTAAMLFDPEKPIPLKSMSLGDDKVVAVALLEPSVFVVLNADRNVVLLRSDENMSTFSINNPVDAFEAEPTHDGQIFKALFGSFMPADLPELVPAAPALRTESTHVFSAPAYAMPSMSQLYLPFFKQLMSVAGPVPLAHPESSEDGIVRAVDDLTVSETADTQRQSRKKARAAVAPSTAGVVEGAFELESFSISDILQH